MKKRIRSLLLTLVAIILTSVTAFSQTATIATDQPDYAPGYTVVITGTGFQPNEIVTIRVVHYDGNGDDDSPAHQPDTTLANADGNVLKTWLVPPDQDELGATLLLTADGQTSGLHAQVVFTDANFTLDNAGLTAATPAAAAYSVRKLSSSYTGNAIQVRRSDGATQNIGFTAAGDLDQSALLLFANGGDATIVIWYDQSGNVYDVIQATVANQPKIVSAGILQTNGARLRPAISFSGGIAGAGALAIRQNLVAATIPNTAYPVSMSVLGNISGTSTNGAFAKFGSNLNGVAIGVGSSGGTSDGTGQSVIGLKEQVAWCPSSPSVNYPSSAFTSTTIQQSAGNALTTFLNGTNIPLAASTSGTVAITGGLFIGGYIASDSSKRYAAVKESEVIIFPSALSTADRQTLECNQNAYYLSSPAAFTSCPSNISVNTGVCTASVSYTATASPVLTYTYSFTGATIASGSGTGTGSTFNKGTTNVTITAHNSCSADAICRFTVTVNNNVIPTITCPAPVTAFTNSGCSATVVSLGTPTGADNCGTSGSLVFTNNHPSTTYSLGATIVTWTATDVAGNTNTCQQTVTVTDNINPVISCPGPIVKNNDAGVCGAVVTYTAPVGTDNCTGSTTTQTAGLASGATFPIGVTINTFKVTDASGNTAECSFTVTVNGTAVFASITSQSDISCFNAHNGTITILASGGTAPYLFSVDNGATWTSGPGSSFTYPGLSAGIAYGIRVEDSNGCKSRSVQ